MALRKIAAIKHGANEARVFRESSDGEFIVKFYRAGKHYEPADYFTDDRGDAEGTARNELERMH